MILIIVLQPFKTWHAMRSLWSSLAGKLLVLKGRCGFVRMKIFRVRFEVYRSVSWFLTLISKHVLKILMLDVLEETTHINSDTIFDTFATSYVLSNFDPIWKSKINSFSYVESAIKAWVIPRSSRNHKLALSMDHFSQFDAIIHQ